MKCEQCGGPLVGKQRRFCSKKCNNRWRAAGRVVPFDCPGCGRTAFVPSKQASRRKYCNRSCATATYNRTHLKGERNGRWRGGHVLAYGPEWKKIKDIVRARDLVCLDCGKTPEENRRALDVHHTDPYRFSGEHDLDSLKALCHSCHMRTEDHGRRGSAKFLRRLAEPKRPIKRKIRELKALLRNAERTARRRHNQAIASLMNEQGASLREIARELEVSHQTVANWLRGIHRLGEPQGVYSVGEADDAA